MVQSLVYQSPDIQKILAFEGAFEKLFNIVQQEGGLEARDLESTAFSDMTDRENPNFRYIY